MVSFGDILSATETAIDSFKSELFSDSASGTGSASATATDAPAPTTSTEWTDAPVADSSGGEATSDGTTAPTTSTTDAPLAETESSSAESDTSSPSTNSIYESDSGDADLNWTSGSASSVSGDSSTSSGSSGSSGSHSLRSESSSLSAYSSTSSSSTSPSAAASALGSNSNSASATSGSSSNVSQSPFESDQGISTTSSTSSSSGMSAASIVGILVGTVAVALVAVAFVFWRRKRQERYSQTSKGDSLRFESSSGRNFAGNGGFKTIQSGRSQQQQLALDMGNGTFNSLNSQASQPDDGPWADPALVAARIPMEMIDKQEMISRGGFGLVFSGTYNGETVAIKTLLPENRKNMKEIEAFFAEIQLMAELEHPRIVRFIGAAWNSLSDVVCVSEFMVGGDLRMLLMNFEGDTGDASQRRPHGFDFEKVQIALHIAHGLTYLHSLAPTVLHRDLKSRNVLLSSTMEAKLTDFGVSRHRSDGLMTCNVGTSLWMAPEVMMGGQYDEKADVFSFGVLLSELDAHVTPYANVVNPSNGRRLVETAILQMVAGGTLQVEFSPECSAEMRALGRACTSLDPRNRPSASDALYKLQLALKAVQEVEVSL